MPAPAANRPSISIVNPAPAWDIQAIVQPSASSSDPPTIIFRRPRAAPSRGAVRAKPKSATERGTSERPAATAVMPSPSGACAKRFVVEEEGHDVEHEEEHQPGGERKVLVRKQ